jgi:hypothetical protein
MASLKVKRQRNGAVYLCDDPDTGGQGLIALWYDREAPTWGQWKAEVFVHGGSTGVWAAETRARAFERAKESLILSMTAAHDGEPE